MSVLEDTSGDGLRGGSTPPHRSTLNSQKLTQMEIRNNEVVFTTTGLPSRGQVQGYHQKPFAMKLNKGGKKDVSGIRSKSAVKRLIGSDDECKYTIGFEVEKNQLSRGAVREYELFCGFERDGSCGYEAVTHVLPLLPPSMWRTKVFNMMHKAERIIDDAFSPSDETCGGHITVCVDGLTGEELLAKMRPVGGLLLAMFRYRLNNKYCGANLRLEPETYDVRCCVDDKRWTSAWVGRYHYQSNGYHSKYRVALPKGECLEWRLPSRFTSVAQMMRRYEFFYEWIDYVMTTKKPTMKTFLKRVDGILDMLYEGDKAKVHAIKVLAYHMQEFINKGTVAPEIAKYVKTMQPDN